VPVKASLAMLGLCEDVFRSPLAPPTARTRELLGEALRELGLLR
jgi:dihydrodipicolinate synthase/N-acetylneuraminate lyase